MEGSKTKETKSPGSLARATWTVERSMGLVERSMGLVERKRLQCCMVRTRTGARAGQAAVRRCSRSQEGRLQTLQVPNDGAQLFSGPIWTNLVPN